MNDSLLFTSPFDFNVTSAPPFEQTPGVIGAAFRLHWKVWSASKGIGSGDMATSAAVIPAGVASLEVSFVIALSLIHI